MARWSWRRKTATCWRVWCLNAPMKPFLIGGALLAILAATGAAPARAAETKPAPIAAKAPVVTWKDSETRQTLFTSDDILFFDWQNQYFLLKDVAFKNYTDWIKSVKLTKAISVEDKNGLVYRARWIGGISSLEYLDPVYLPNPGESIRPQFIVSIASGHPNVPTPLPMDDSQKLIDFRNSARLRTDLQAAGVLKPDELSALSLEREGSDTLKQWRRIGLNANVAVQCFSTDFVLGQQPHADFLFATDEEFRKQWDALAIEIRYVANDGQFRSDTRVEAISPQIMAEHVHHFQLPPWKPVAGSQASVTSPAGSVTFSLLFQQQRNGQMVTARRVEFDAIVLPLRNYVSRW